MFFNPFLPPKNSPQPGGKGNPFHSLPVNFWGKDPPQLSPGLTLLGVYPPHFPTQPFPKNGLTFFCYHKGTPFFPKTPNLTQGAFPPKGAHFFPHGAPNLSLLGEGSRREF